MTDHQVTLLAAGLTTSVPALAVLIGIFVNYRQVDSLRREMEARFETMNVRFATINTEIKSLRVEMNARFQAAHEALLRVEGVLDARLKHVEETLRR